MYTVTRTFTRPDTSVAFFDARTTSDEFREYFRENYIATSKSILIHHELSSDSLVLTATSLWDTEESFNQFLNDSTCALIVQAAQTYNTTNGITEQVEYESL